MAKTWTEVGAKGVVLVGRDAKKLEEVASHFKGNTLVAAGDITKEEDVRSIFEKAVAKFGSVDVVVNSAGLLSYGTIGELEPSNWWADHVSFLRQIMPAPNHGSCYSVPAADS